MTLLNRFLKFLEWLDTSLETIQDFFYFLKQPVGISAVTAFLLYCPLQLLGCDSLSAATLSCSTAMTLFCLLERPDF